MSEISKATKHEAFLIPSKVASFSRHIKSKMADMEKKLEQYHRKSSMSHCNDVSDISAMESGNIIELFPVTNNCRIFPLTESGNTTECSHDISRKYNLVTHTYH